MATKKVFCYNVRLADGYEFSDVLKDKRFHNPVNLGLKTIEIGHLSVDAGKRLIYGIFVATQTKDVPPAHKPGEDDYSAIPLESGEGLAYPNAFLYCEQTKVLFMEYNRYGVTPNFLYEFFGANAQRENLLDWEMGIEIVLNRDAYERASKLTSIKEFVIQVASPEQLLFEESKSKGAISEVVQFASEYNATKAITITLKGNYNDGGITQNKILSLIKKLQSIGQKTDTASGRMKNSIVVVGKTRLGEENNLEGQEIEDTINLFLDKVEGYFELENIRLHTNLQPTARKTGMYDVYYALIGTIRSLIGIRG